MNSCLKLSVVTTLYHSEEYIGEFHRRVSLVANQLAGDDYEIIFVDDASPDNGIQIAIDLAENDCHTSVIELSRNFGHHKAMMTGLAHAKGDFVFLTDCDLEEDPEYLPVFFEQMQEKQADVIYGEQERRRGKLFERMSGATFYYLFNKLTGVSIPKNVVTSRLMKKKYVKALIRHEERELFIAGIWYITGFRQVPVIVKKHSLSSTTYTFRKKISILINSATSFSNLPLMIIFYTGMTICLFSFTHFAYLLLNWLFFSKPLAGWTSTIASIWFLGGLIIFFIGVVGIYLSKIFIEVKRRPYTIIREIYRKE